MARCAFATKLAVAVWGAPRLPGGALRHGHGVHLASRSFAGREVHPRAVRVPLGIHAVLVLQGLSLGMLLGTLRTLAGRGGDAGRPGHSWGSGLPLGQGAQPLPAARAAPDGDHWTRRGRPWRAGRRRGALVLAWRRLLRRPRGPAACSGWPQARGASSGPGVVMVVTAGACSGRPPGGQGRRRGPRGGAGERARPRSWAPSSGPARARFIATRRFTFATRLPRFGVKPLAEKADAPSTRSRALAAGARRAHRRGHVGLARNTWAPPFRRVRMTPTEEEPTEEVLIHEDGHTCWAARMLDERRERAARPAGGAQRGPGQWVASAPRRRGRAVERDAFTAAVVSRGTR
jgi:hypothetical protein